MVHTNRQSRCPVRSYGPLIGNGPFNKKESTMLFRDKPWAVSIPDSFAPSIDGAVSFEEEVSWDEASGIAKRYVAGMQSLLSSSSTTVELEPIVKMRDPEGDFAYDDFSYFFTVRCTNGKNRSETDEFPDREARLTCGLEVHRTIGGKVEWGVYGPIRLTVTSRRADDHTTFVVWSPSERTKTSIGGLIASSLFGQLMTAQMDDDEGES